MTEAEIREGLDRWFGHADFRPGQYAPVEAVVNGCDAVVVMPTGAGKSLCFQLTALLMPGITVVVMEEFREGRCKLVYIAPERFANPQFRERLEGRASLAALSSIFGIYRQTREEYGEDLLEIIREHQ